MEATDLPLEQQETHLGDGLYVSFDGYQLKLRAPRMEGDHWVALEPGVYRQFLRWVRQYPRLREYMEGK